MGAPSSGSANVQVDSINRVFFVEAKETMQWWGYDMDSGDNLWGPVGEFRAFQYYGTVSNPPAPGYVYNGAFYVAGYGGILNCFESRTGALKWSYGNGGAGNSTNSGLDTPWGNYPLFIGAIADGKIYCFSSEHSPNAPLYKNELVRCIDAATGAEIWTMMGWPGLGSFGQTGTPIADGNLIYLNIYDMQIYCVGKGPSATTVSVGPKVATKGSSVVIEGTVNDVSVGAKAKIEEGAFNSVPAMSDTDQGAWMEHIFMQKPTPADATGVPVTIFATGPSGTTDQIGEVTSDINGMYYLKWTPPTEGTYVINAVFQGSKSYWGSSATTVVAVDPASAPVVTSTPTPTETLSPTATPTTPAPTTTAPQPGTDYTTAIYVAVAAIIIVVIIAAAAVMLRRRK